MSEEVDAAHWDHRYVYGTGLKVDFYHDGETVKLTCNHDDCNDFLVVIPNCEYDSIPDDGPELEAALNGLDIDDLKDFHEMWSETTD